MFSMTLYSFGEVWIFFLGGEVLIIHLASVIFLGGEVFKLKKKIVFLKRDRNGMFSMVLYSFGEVWFFLGGLRGFQNEI